MYLSPGDLETSCAGDRVARAALLSVPSALPTHLCPGRWHHGSDGRAPDQAAGPADSAGV